MFSEKKAQKSGARLLVSDVHDYGVERDGIWLPSSTTISEYYVISVVPVKENSGYPVSLISADFGIQLQMGNLVQGHRKEMVLTSEVNFYEELFKAHHHCQ